MTDRPASGEARGDQLGSLGRLARRSPYQTFAIVPLLTLASELLVRRRLRLRSEWLLLCAAGYGLYRVSGAYRTGHGAGSEGFARPPQRLVTTGPYALSRNPMYLGHLLFVAGVVLATGSPVAVAGFVWEWRRFSRRVRIDEERIERIFGDEYREYARRVPRWVPFWES